jgi:apolipoprotein N-acyltransferase
MKLKELALLIISSLLLILCFPNFNLGFMAWVGLFPLLLLIDKKNLARSFFLSLGCGILFFLGIFHWILSIPKFSVLQQIALALYLGSYLGLFGVAFSFISTRWSHTLALWAAPFLWVSLEYIRSNLSFLALPWGLLAHSQHQYPTVIQIASITGTYSLSFLIVMVNAALAALFSSYLPIFQAKKIPPNLHLKKGEGFFPLIGDGKAALIVTSAFLVFLTIFYGQLTVSKSIIGDRIKISVVQGNIDQSKKWDAQYAQEIMKIYTELTQEAAKDQPALIIWPETATPGGVNQDMRLYMEVRNIAKKAGTHLLIGSSQQQKIAGKGKKDLKYFNSAFLISPEPKAVKNQRYDKIRLFPFGEYLPFQEFIPWSSFGVPNMIGYVSGKEFTVFALPEFRFGVTICWENVFPDLFRQFIKNGAQFMINITNEAWFGRSAAPHHLVSISVFRAVENRVFVVRCANTGVSCIIDPYGRIIDRVRDEKGQDIFIRGVIGGWVTPLETRTIYTQYGDLFPWVCMVVSAAFLLAACVRSQFVRKGGIFRRGHRVVLRKPNPKS